MLGRGFFLLRFMEGQFLCQVSREARSPRKALREKYACGMISHSKVMTTAEKKNALSPARTASDNNVSRTLVLTLLQITVVRIWLEFLRS